jgi:hypothetical protein
VHRLRLPVGTACGDMSVLLTCPLTAIGGPFTIAVHLRVQWSSRSVIRRPRQKARPGPRTAAQTAWAQLLLATLQRPLFTISCCTLPQYQPIAMSDKVRTAAARSCAAAAHCAVLPHCNQQRAPLICARTKTAAAARRWHCMGSAAGCRRCLGSGGCGPGCLCPSGAAAASGRGWGRAACRLMPPPPPMLPPHCRRFTLAPAGCVQGGWQEGRRPSGAHAASVTQRCLLRMGGGCAAFCLAPLPLVAGSCSS